MERYFKMLKTVLFSLAIALAFQSLAITSTQHLSVHFSYDGYELDRNAQTELAGFISALDLDADHMFVVSGHTDNDGGLSYNDMLSLKRARAVESFLKAKGVNAEAIMLHSFGERSPLVANNSEEDQQLNRRVTVVFEQYQLDDLSELEGKLGQFNTTEFRIDPNKRNYLRGENGCIIKVPGNAFVDANGNPISDHVDVRMTEALSFDQFVAEGLSTISDGRILISGGMMRLEAFDANGQAIELDGNSEMTISIPSAQRQDGMQLFVSNNGADWENTGQEARELPKLDLPKRPFATYPNFDRPLYKADLASKPRKPGEPARPHEPNKPRKASYHSKTFWYDFMYKDKIKARDALRYEAALERYDGKVEKFISRMEKYHEDCKVYPMNKVKFEKDLDTWNKKNEADSLVFEKSIVGAAYAAHLKMREQYIARNETDRKEWQAQCDSLMDTYAERLDSLGLADVNNMNRYIFSSNKMGWINCDRFYEVPQSQKFDLVIQDRDTTAEKVYVVFTEIKSMIQLRKKDGNFMTKNLPRNQPAMIFAYKVVNGKSMLCYKPMNTRSENRLVFKLSKFSEIRKVLRDLNAGVTS